jgi:hypothetical protein
MTIWPSASALISFMLEMLCFQHSALVAPYVSRRDSHPPVEHAGGTGNAGLRAGADEVHLVVDARFSNRRVGRCRVEIGGDANNAQHIDLQFFGASHEVFDFGVTHFRETECIDFQRVEAESLHLFKVWHVVHIPFRAPVAVENAYFVHVLPDCCLSSLGVIRLFLLPKNAVGVPRWNFAQSGMWEGPCTGA